MKKLRNLIAVMAMMSMATFLTGCGDDDDNDDDDALPQDPGFVAPGDEAALTAQNKIYTVNVAGQNDPIQLTFPAAGQYQLVQAGVTEVGTISGATRDVNRWTLNVTPNEGQDGAQAGVLQLDFTAADAGAWTFTPTDGVAETGTFTVTTTGGDPGGDNGGDPGELPADLVNRTLQISYPGGGGEKFQFTSANAVSYEDGAESGTYTYSQQDGRVTVALGNGWSYDITLQQGGNASVFFKQNAEDPGTTDAATYTLTQ